MSRPPDLPRFKQLGERIRYWRDKQEIGRKDLAKRVGMGYSTLADLENGESHSTALLYKFAQELRLNLRYLETDEGDPFADPPPAVEEWPFPEVPKDVILKLSRLGKKHVQNAIKEALRDIEDDRKSTRDTG